MFEFDEKQLTLDLLNLKTPVIEVREEISYNVYNRIEFSLTYLRTKNSPDIEIVISSHEGMLAASLDLYDMLRLYKGIKTGIVEHQAASMAAILLQACDIRKCALHATLLIHCVSMGWVRFDQLTDRKKLNQLRRDLTLDQSRLEVIVAAHTGKSLKAVRRKMNENKMMTAEEALEFGLIDGII